MWKCHCQFQSLNIKVLTSISQHLDIPTFNTRRCCYFTQQKGFKFTFLDMTLLGEWPSMKSIASNEEFLRNQSQDRWYLRTIMFIETYMQRPHLQLLETGLHLQAFLPLLFLGTRLSNLRKPQYNSLLAPISIFDWSRAVSRKLLTPWCFSWNTFTKLTLKKIEVD